MTKIATQPRIHFTSLRLMAFRDTFDFSDNQFFFGSKLHQNWNVIAYLKEEVPILGDSLRCWLGFGCQTVFY